MKECEFYRPDVDIRKSDVLISMEKGPDGSIISPRVRIFCRNDEGKMEQIGLIEEFEFRADVKKTPVTLRARFPRISDGMSDQLKKAMARHRKMLEDHGVALDMCTCVVREDSMGIDPNCPQHGSGS